VIDAGREFAAANEYRRKLNIRCPWRIPARGESLGRQPAEGGAGQMAVLEAELLILDEPTRGIDVGAKYEIYSIMAALADEGKSIVMISSEMPELLGMCDRIYVMNEGRFVGEFPAAEASQERIMRAIVKQGNVA
jgi:putative multiple sugar transport system ATP-binding protein